MGDDDLLPSEFRDQLALLAAAYLREVDPLRQSGYAGGPTRWRAERACILEAIDGDGELLDLGCANGYLLEAKVKATRRLATPNLFLQGGADRVTPPAASEKMAARYSGPFERIVLDGVGHFLPREAPDLVAEHLLRHFGAAPESPS